MKFSIFIGSSIFLMGCVHSPLDEYQKLYRTENSQLWKKSLCVNMAIVGRDQVIASSPPGFTIGDEMMSLS